MSSEHTERDMAFMIEQQAKFTVDMARMNEQMSALVDGLDRVTQQVGKLTDILVSLTNVVEQHDSQIASNEAQIAALAEQGKETAARLNALIEMVERHISGHR
jgi:ABC-type transporter Mla subunit MlaD